MKTFITITPAIRYAIIDAIEHDFSGKNKILAAEIKVSPSSVGRWLKPDERGSIENSVYIRLLPHIKKYMGKNATPIPTPITSECEKLCEELQPFEKDTLKQYTELQGDIRKETFKKWDDIVVDAKKKSSGHGDTKVFKTGS